MNMGILNGYLFVKMYCLVLKASGQRAVGLAVGKRSGVPFKRLDDRAIDFIVGESMVL